MMPHMPRPQHATHDSHAASPTQHTLRAPGAGYDPWPACPGQAVPVLPRRHHGRARGTACHAVWRRDAPVPTATSLTPQAAHHRPQGPAAGSVGGAGGEGLPSAHRAPSAPQSTGAIAPARRVLPLAGGRGEGPSRALRCCGLGPVGFAAEVAVHGPSGAVVTSLRGVGCGAASTLVTCGDALTLTRCMAGSGSSSGAAAAAATAATAHLSIKLADRVITQSTGLAGRLRNKSLAP